MVGWSSETFKTLTNKPVKSLDNETRRMTVRLRDALIERCLAGSGLRPGDRDGDLVLDTTLISYKEYVVATDVDGRTQRVQFALLANFSLTDTSGRLIWTLKNYRYSDQFNISTGRDAYSDEAVYSQDEALKTVADLVITNITLALEEFVQDHE